MSIASEITRIQNAKASLKAAINAKLPAGEQITAETIDEFPDFVEDILTNAGAFKVTTVQEMNALTDMQEGDYCIIKGTSEYIIPESATFTRFTGSAADLQSGKYSNYMFVMCVDYFGTQSIVVGEAPRVNARYNYYSIWLDTSKTFINNSITFTIDNDTKKYICRFEHQDNDTLAVHWLNNSYLKFGTHLSGGSSWMLNVTGYFDAVDLFLSDFTFNVNNQTYSYKLKNATGDTYTNRIISTSTGDLPYIYTYTTSSGTTAPIKLYAAKMQSTTVDHLVYQYLNGAWVDVTDAILVPTTNVTPSATTQTLPIPAGYRGFKTVNVLGTSLGTATVTPSTSSQTVTPTSPDIGLSSVTVNAIPIETKSVTPSTSAQTITPTSGSYITQVNVAAVDNAIDNNITAGNIKRGVSILGVTGTYNTGAYSVSDVTEMNALTDMQNGDYCVVESILTGYTRVDYIQSSGTQYIDTHYYPYKTKTEIRFQFTSTTGAQYIAGVYSNTSGYERWYDTVGINTKTSGKMTIVNATNTVIHTRDIDTLAHTLIYNDANNKVLFDNQEVGNTSDLPVRTNNQLYLFAKRGSSSAGNLSSSKIFYAKIWDGGTLVREFIPCYRNSDNVIGMYDVVTGTFYTNAGTGTFTKGADASPITITTLYQYNGTTWVQV